MLIELSGGEADVRFNVFAGCTLSLELLNGTRGDRREGVNVDLSMRAGIDLRWPFFGGIVN
jgi:hypothetical protein